MNRIDRTSKNLSYVFMIFHNLDKPVTQDKGKLFQQMTTGQLTTHVGKDKVVPLLHTIYKSQLIQPQRL